MLNEEWKDIKYFKSREFVCPHCGIEDMNLNLVQSIDAIRGITGIPITIPSGYRCEIHNKEVGGVKNSFHLIGKAIDITIKEIKAIPLFYKICIVSSLFKGYGFNPYKNFIHLDIGTDYNRYFIYLPDGKTAPVKDRILKQINSCTIENYLDFIKEKKFDEYNGI